MGDLIAWSPIKVGEPTKNAENPGEVRTIKPGETVTKDDLGLDDEGWKQLLESGAVRDSDVVKYPDMPEAYQGSPVEFLREQARKAADEALLGADTSEANLGAIATANAVATGQALPSEPQFSPEVQEEMDRQLAEQNAAAGNGNGSAEGAVTYRKNDNGDLFASEDGGETWRPATAAEKAEQG